MNDNTRPLLAGRRATRLALLILAAASLLALGGCATARNPRDPLEPVNRQVTQFNEAVDSVLLKPVATAYKEKVPALLRTGVSNFFGNLGDLWSGVNSAAQAKAGDAAENLLRFGVNTFFGFGGVLDIASELNIERHKEDFGQTLGRWGVPAGPYVVLPILGPSTLRDTLALPVDRRGDLVREVTPDRDRHLLYGTRVVDTRANLLRVGNVIDQAALDKYTFTRDAYLQKRRAEIQERRGENQDDGQTPTTEELGRGGSAPADGGKR